MELLLHNVYENLFADLIIKDEKRNIEKGKEIGVRKGVNMVKQAYHYLISCGRESEVSRLFEDDQFLDEIVAEMQK